MFYVCVKSAARKRICSSGLIWVKDARHELYVSKKERGAFETKADAQYAITEPWEIIVEGK